LYCNQSCRQRAYEIRTAARRGDARAAAAALPAPVERVIERVIEADYPTTPGRWIKALDELTARLGDGRIPTHEHGQIRAATLRVLAALEETQPRPRAAPVAYAPRFRAAPRPAMVIEPDDELTDTTPQDVDAMVRLFRPTPPPLIADADDKPANPTPHVADASDHRSQPAPLTNATQAGEDVSGITAEGMDAMTRLLRIYRANEPQHVSATLQRLAAQTDADTDAIREALRVLHDAGHATLTRNGEPTHPRELTEHARFTLTLLPIFGR
jgi:hypothetical protein